MNRFDQEKQAVTILRQDHYIGSPSIWEAWNWFGYRVVTADSFEDVVRSASRQYRYAKIRPPGQELADYVPLGELREDQVMKTSERY